MIISYKVRIVAIILLYVSIPGTIKSQEVKIFKSFPKTITLMNDKIMETPELFCPSRIYIVDSLLFIEELCNKHFFQVYSKNHFSYIGFLGNKGKGPGEFNMLHYNNQFNKDNLGNINIWMYDAIAMKAFKINLKRAINISNGEKFIEKKITMPAQGYPTNHLVILDENNCMIGDNNMNEFGRFFIYDYKKNIFRWSDNIPEPPIGTPSTNLGSLYVAEYCYNRKRNIIVSSMTFFERIDFINKNGNIVFTIKRDNNNPTPDFSDPIHPTNKENHFYYYNGIVLTDNYIVVVNWEAQWKILKGDVKRKMIQFFSYEGEPIIDFIINKNFSYFTYDQETKRIFIIDKDDEEYPIKYFEVDKYL